MLIAAPVVLGQSLSEKKQDVDSQIGGLRDEIETAEAQEGVLTSEIEAAASEIDSLSSDIAELNDAVAHLESDLTIEQARLAELKELHRAQTRRLKLLRGQVTEAERRVEDRLVELYTTEQPDALAVLLGAGSLSELIEQLKLLSAIGRQDQLIADELKLAKGEMRLARRDTAATRAEQAEVTAIVAQKAAERHAARDALVARQQEIVAARSDRQALLAGVQGQRQEAQEDLDAMLATSRELAAKIQAAQQAATAQAAAASSGDSGSDPHVAVTGGGAVSASGLTWPVGGVLTSGFGPRWGRMHEGIDIAAPIGTPIVAASGGTVIYSGWLGSYGMLVVIDHGNGISTAYGHQSSIGVGLGPVSQGQVVGLVGSTGRSTGPHLHFEVRINGGPVNPLEYL